MIISTSWRWGLANPNPDVSLRKCFLFILPAAKFRYPGLPAGRILKKKFYFSFFIFWKSSLAVIRYSVSPRCEHHIQQEFSMLNAMPAGNMFCVEGIWESATVDDVEESINISVDGSCDSQLHKRRSVREQSKWICAWLLLLKWSLSTVFLRVLQRQRRWM